MSEGEKELKKRRGNYVMARSNSIRQFDSKEKLGLMLELGYSRGDHEVGEGTILRKFIVSLV